MDSAGRPKTGMLIFEEIEGIASRVLPLEPFDSPLTSFGARSWQAIKGRGECPEQGERVEGLIAGHSFKDSDRIVEG